jgi:hypothetical protein
MTDNPSELRLDFHAVLRRFPALATGEIAATDPAALRQLEQATVDRTRLVAGTNQATTGFPFFQHGECPHG